MVNFCIKIEFQVCARLWAGFCSNILGIYVDFRCWYVWQGTKDFGYLDSTCSTVGSWVSRTPRCPLMYLSSEVTVSITVTPAVGFGWFRNFQMWAFACLACLLFGGGLGTSWSCDLNLPNSHECWWSQGPVVAPPIQARGLLRVSECEKQNVTTSELRCDFMGFIVESLFAAFRWNLPEKLGKTKHPKISGVVSPMLPEWNLGSKRCRRVLLHVAPGDEFFLNLVKNGQEWFEKFEECLKNQEFKNFPDTRSISLFFTELHRLRFIPSRDLSKIFLSNAPDEAQRIYFHSDDGDALQKEWLVYLGFSSSKTSRDFRSLSFKVSKHLTVSFSGSADRYLKP